jgi:hypothetical protein
MTYAPTCRFAIGVFFSLAVGSLALGGCAGGSSNSGTGGSSATGGSSTGGGIGTGGTNTGTGGNGSGTGGSVGTGGTSTGTGGSVSNTGGSVGTGGSGTGGSVSTGGSTGTGGGSVGTGGSGSGGKGGSGGGAAGASGSGGTAGAGVTPFFTDNFDSDTMGQQPAGWDNFIAYNYKTTNPDSDGSSALVDATHTHNGSKFAVHFKVTGSDPVLLERALPAGTNHLNVRAYFYLTTQMGDLPMSGGDNHETLLGLTADPTSANTQVRFGQIKGVIGTNQVPSDNIAPIMADWYGGAVISPNTWHCIEVEFAGDATYNSLYAWVDGTLVHSITAATDWQNGALAANWMNGMFVDAMFGWQSFSNIATELWMDDLALSTGSIGCN